MGTLGTMVSKKFEVDESYWHIDGDKELSAEQKQKEIEKLDNKGRQLDLRTYALGLGALTTFLPRFVSPRNSIILGCLIFFWLEPKETKVQA